jgi:hypothetical protein
VGDEPSKLLVRPLLGDPCPDMLLLPFVLWLLFEDETAPPPEDDEEATTAAVDDDVDDAAADRPGKGLSGRLDETADELLLLLLEEDPLAIPFQATKTTNTVELIVGETDTDID